MKDINTEALKRIAESWDGCMYDSVGESIDIGKCLREQFAALSPPAVTDISGKEGEREAFEAAVRSKNPQHLIFPKWEDETYKNHQMQQMWVGWQLGRAALSQPPANPCPLCDGHGTAPVWAGENKAQPPAVQVPEGWKLVPAKPTAEWREKLDDIGYSHRTVIRDVLAAAPLPRCCTGGRGDGGSVRTVSNAAQGSSKEGRKQMTDREMLELAAKAHGNIRRLEGCDSLMDDDADDFWNPLADDADALRLAVKLRMRVHHDGSCAHVELSTGQKYCWIESAVVEGNDHNEATRHAIVRAAAEIGKAKEG